MVVQTTKRKFIYFAFKHNFYLIKFLLEWISVNCFEMFKKIEKVKHS